MCKGRGLPAVPLAPWAPARWGAAGSLGPGALGRGVSHRPAVKYKKRRARPPSLPALPRKTQHLLPN